MMNEPEVSPRKALPATWEEADVGRVRSLWADALSRLMRNPGSVLGAVILAALILAAIFAPQITRYNPVELAAADRLKPPSAQHWFGTDAFGQDIYTRTVYGSRISLRMGAISVAIAVLLGVTSGLLAGYFGGHLDTWIMRAVDITLAFPGILLALVIIAILGPSLFNAMVAVGISAAPTYARVTRGMVLKTREEVYIESAIASGCRPVRVILRHILPNILGPIVVVATLGVAGAIISGAALSFLGLGATPPTPEWGLMLSSGRNYLRAAWWITSFPGLAIMVTVLSINLLGDGLRDALDPHMQR
jgi:peptide/nickel transport system permease protein